MLAATALGGLALATRTRGYDRIAPDLKGWTWRFRTPPINALTLPLARAMNSSVTKCLDGVWLDTRQTTSKDGTPIAVYVYRPEGVSSDAAFFFTHGGGMVLGSAAHYHEIVSGYAKQLGIIVVSTEYRLAPEHPFPTPLDDVHAGWTWLRDHAGELGIDSGRIAVGGESAGGGLTAGLCQRLLDEKGTMPAFQLLIYPMLDDRTTLHPAPKDRGQLVWTVSSNRHAWSSYLGRKPQQGSAPHYAAPARRTDLKGLPPAWIGVGTLDLFHDEDVDYAGRLRQAGIACDLRIVDGAFHAFNLVMATPLGNEFTNGFLDAVRTALKLSKG